MGGGGCGQQEKLKEEERACFLLLEHCDNHNYFGYDGPSNGQRLAWCLDGTIDTAAMGRNKGTDRGEGGEEGKRCSPVTASSLHFYHCCW